MGFVPYYEHECTSLGTVYAVYCKHLSAVALISPDIRGAEIALAVANLGETIPFGKLCAWCGKRAAAGDARLKKCPCKKCRYCSRECQLAHWGDHRPACLSKEERLLL